MQVPYEDLDPGPIGSLLGIDPMGAAKPLETTALDPDQPHLPFTDGPAPSPSDGQFHLQMIYAVCSLTYAAFRRALDRDIG